MNPTFTLGRIAGVRIAINWTWAIVFGLIVWSLADSVFPDTNPGLSGAAYVTMALAAAALFFASLLLHELGHAVQARRDGLRVDHITLWLFGGVARLRGEFASAGVEFRVAVAGPAVTVVLAGVFLALSLAAPLPSGVDGVVAWLAYINVFLLAFNLLPALPLDGGRVFRSALWRAKRDFVWATRIAVGVSRALALALVGAGVVLLFVDDAMGGIWLSFIGLFLFQAASSERRDLAVRGALAGLRVGDLMRPYGPWSAWLQAPAYGMTLASSDTALEALERLTARRAGGALVVDSGNVVGVISLGDLARVLMGAPAPGAPHAGYS